LTASLLVLTTGCGTHQDRPPTGAASASATASRPGSITPRHPLEAHYFIGYGEGGTYDPKAGKADVISDGTRYRIEITGNGADYAGFRELLVFDGHRLFRDENDMAPQYVIYDAPHQHPEELGFGSGLIYDPKMAPWNAWCGHQAPVLSSTGTRLGRNAQVYQCPVKAKVPSVWVDQATGLVLQMGKMKAQDLVMNPSITTETFSAEPPNGVKAQVVPAK
jgi:hypothetical protein